MRLTAVALSALLAASTLGAQQIPRAIVTDPPRDSLHPARSEILHIPTGGVKINGLAYIPPGAGVHPTLLLLHGLPGNEKNLDLAQAVRRAGWIAVTFNYRGSWGSPGVFRFGNVLEDADAVLAFLRDPANARALGVDTSRIVLAGHSMGGWATVLTAAHDHALYGAVLVSMAEMSRWATVPRDTTIAHMADDMESLAGVTAASMTDDLAAGAARWHVNDKASTFARLPLLVLTSDDGLAPPADSLVRLARAQGNTRVTATHVATDHVWSNRRITLQAEVIRWLQGLGAR